MVISHVLISREGIKASSHSDIYAVILHYCKVTRWSSLCYVKRVFCPKITGPICSLEFYMNQKMDDANGLYIFSFFPLPLPLLLLLLLRLLLCRLLLRLRLLPKYHFFFFCIIIVVVLFCYFLLPLLLRLFFMFLFK